MSSRGSLSYQFEEKRLKPRLTMAMVRTTADIP
jgi:hypothetical protein